MIPAAAAIVLAIYFFIPREEPDPVPGTSLELIQADLSQQTETPTQKEELPENVMVDIKGHVAKPGVYELPNGARAQEAIAAAGGFLPEADSRAINLAMKVADEMVLYVPKTGEEAVLPPQAVAPSGEALVDLNSATEAQLMELPGIGPSKAAAIIAYRTENGKFAKIEDLTNVTGIGDKTFEQLKDGITAK